MSEKKVNPKLIKVSFEYDDGTVRTLRNKDAEKWMGQVNSSISMDFVHGGSFDCPEFEVSTNYGAKITNYFKPK